MEREYALVAIMTSRQKSSLPNHLGIIAIDTNYLSLVADVFLGDARPRAAFPSRLSDLRLPVSC
jgi:hypothetical protein